MKYLAVVFVAYVFWAFSLGVQYSNVDPLAGKEFPEYQFELDTSRIIMAVKDYREVMGHVPTLEEGGLEPLLLMNKVPSPKLTAWPREMAEHVRDFWGNLYVYDPTKDVEGRGFGVYSLGRDGVSKTGGNDPDDLNSWSGRQSFYIKEAQEAYSKGFFKKLLVYGGVTSVFVCLIMWWLFRTFPALNPKPEKKRGGGWEVID